MSDDPETARQIAELSLDTRPLLVLDVDDVLMDFIQPFIRYLDGRGYKLPLRSFKLTGNLARKDTGELVDKDGVSELLNTFFAAQADWQVAAPGSVETLQAFNSDVEIVMLTAMPHQHRAVRRKHLDRIGFPYPLLTTEAAKGPAIRKLRGTSGRPVAFVDDIPNNLASARAAVADAHLFHLMTFPSLRDLLPPFPEDIRVVDDWADAGPKIAAALQVGAAQSV